MAAIGFVHIAFGGTCNGRLISIRPWSRKLKARKVNPSQSVDSDIDEASKSRRQIELSWPAHASARKPTGTRTQIY